MKNRVYNVGTGSQTSIRDLAILESELILSDSSSGLPIEYLKAKKGNVARSYGDVSRIRTDDLIARKLQSWIPCVKS